MANIILTNEQLELIKEDLRKEILHELQNPKDLVGKQVVIIENHDNGGDKLNNLKFYSRAYNHMTKLIYQFDNHMYLTDFFLPEFIKENNDYVHYGFLKINNLDFKMII